MSVTASTELQEALIKITRFSPRRAIKRLVKAETKGSKIYAVLKTWELARLLGWVVLDQQPGTRRPKAKASDKSKSSKRRMRKSNARRTGDIMLAWLLDDILKETRKRRSNEDDSDFKLIIALIKSRGGFSKLVEGRSGKLLLAQAARKLRELGYIYQLIDFLCRYKGHNPDNSKFDIKAAFYFVEKQHA